MPGLLRYRRTYAVALVALVLVSVAIGALRGDDGDDETGGDGPAVEVSPEQSPTTGETPDGEDGDTDAGPAYPTAVAPSRPPTDAASGLPVVGLADLPPEAAETVALIDAGGPFPFPDDGETFLNSDALLPPREGGYYRVYTVESPGSAGPSQRRIVSGSDGELYWTDDLYASFRRIEQ